MATDKVLGKRPPLATPLAGYAELRSACPMSEVKELTYCCLKARNQVTVLTNLSNGIEEHT